MGVTVILVLIIALTRLSHRHIAITSDGRAYLTEEPSSGGTDTEQPGYVISTTELYGNVVLSQGVFAVLLIGLAWFFAVPRAALGATAITPGRMAIVVGLGLGVVLAAGNEGSVYLLDRVGIGYSTALRRSLAPDRWWGWVLLAVVVLPVIAGFEELLFRGILIGGFSVATGISPWIFVGLSSLVFAFGHGIQGKGGILVTGILGLVLGAAFVAIQDLWVVIVAHYLVNLLEFVINEGLAPRWR